MPDKKPNRLGRLEKGRKFAPRVPVRKEEEIDSLHLTSSTGPAAATDAGHDPFKDLIAQAKDTEQKGPSRQRKWQQEGLKVAFGGQDAASTPEGKRQDAVASGLSGKRGTGSDSSRGARPAGAARAGTDGPVKVEGGSPVVCEGARHGKPKEARPCLDPDAYYPTMLPFRDVHLPHNADALADAALPIDLASKSEEPEPATAEELGIHPAANTGHVVLLQMPCVLPSLALLGSAAQGSKGSTASRMAEGSSSRAAPSTLQLPEASTLLDALPCGKIGVVQVTKRGRMRMKVGCATLEVTPGIPQLSRHELHFINLRTNEIVEVAADMPVAVASVDIEALLS